MVTQDDNTGNGKGGEGRKVAWNKALLQTMRKILTGFVLSSLVLLFGVILLWDTVVVSYHPGQQGVYWSRFFGGTSNVSLDEGTSYKLPWDDIFIYDMGPLTIEETTAFLSNDGMEMQVQWSVRFRLSSATLPDLHRGVGPDYADKVVVPEIASFMRQILGKYRAEEILSYDKNSLMEQISASMLKQFSEGLIVAQNILIHRLIPPQEVAN